MKPAGTVCAAIPVCVAALLSSSPALATLPSPLSPVALQRAPLAAGLAQDEPSPFRPTVGLAPQIGATLAVDTWRLDRQPLFLAAGAPAADTLALQHRLDPALLFAAAATYFPNPHLGLSVEAAVSTANLGMDCRALATSRVGDQLCESIETEADRPATLYFVQVAGTITGNLERRVSPFVRLSGGVSVQTGRFVTTAGSYIPPGLQPVPLTVIDGRKAQENASPALGLAAGAFVRLGRSYLLRLEVRDEILWVPEPAAPAHADAQVPIRDRAIHLPGIAIGLEILFERTRERR